MSAQPETPRVVVTVAAGVAEVRLNRPEKLNAFDAAMFTGLVAAGERLRADRQVRAVVISGEGRGFSAGLDLSMFAGMAGGDGARVVSELTGSRQDGPGNAAQRAVWVWRELEVPVIAAVHGPALGAGFQLALGADLRIVTPDASMSVLEVRWGLIPDMSGTYLLPRLVGPDVAKELTWTGRMVGGEEALRIGLATRLAEDPRAAALELAGQLAQASPHAIRQGKRLLEASLDRGPAEHLADEATTMASLIGSPNQTEAVAAWFDKRDPSFADA
jgi:enoyl-CoA hydratase/carnithine racemase